MVVKLNIQEAVYQRITRSMPVLFAMLLSAALAKRIGWFSVRKADSLSGINRLDGTIGILLGFAKCIGSRPAANMLDILLFMKADIRENLVSTNMGRAWLFLNLIIVIVSWVGNLYWNYAFSLNPCVMWLTNLCMYPSPEPHHSHSCTSLLES